MILNRPQEPKPPFPYFFEEIRYENKIDRVTIAGTLTFPATQNPYPVVLLITGSGPHDRDQNVCGHKIFLVLADHLTKQGIAVLRIDKQGIGQSTGHYETATTENFANDILAGVEYLMTRKEIIPSQIGLIGHSEGGLIAPIAASKTEDIAFIVLMAATGINGEKILYEQRKMLEKAEGATETQRASSRKQQEEFIAIVKAEADIQAAEIALKKAYEGYTDELSDESIKAAAKANADMTIQSFNTKWFRNFLKLEPSAALRQVKVPVLALNGARDLQVCPKQNLPAIANALKEGGNKAYTIVEVPGLNHLFQTCQTGSVTEYNQIEETISPIALNLISEWIKLTLAQ